MKPKRAEVLMRFVLDTSALTDPRLRKVFGVEELWEAVNKCLELMALGRTRLGFTYYTTPSVLKEVRGFLERSSSPGEVVARLSVWLTPATPSLNELKIPATIFVEYVEEVRRRLDKGLRVAEESTRKAFGGGDVGEHIRNLREKYRESTRKGLLDSVADLEAVMLAYQLNAVLVSNDEGLCKMARKLGVTCIDPLTFLRTLEEYLRLAKRGAGEQA
jgi:RNA ligase partner protein